MIKKCVLTVSGIRLFEFADEYELNRFLNSNGGVYDIDQKDLAERDYAREVHMAVNSIFNRWSHIVSVRDQIQFA